MKMLSKPLSKSLSKLRLRLLVVLLVFILVFLTSWIFWRELKRVSAVEMISWSVDHYADCAIVLTGGPGRVREGFDLLSQKRVKKLIISGVNPQAHLRDIFPEWPFYGGLREEDVILERRSTTTYGNVQQSLPLVEALRCRDAILVTSKLHMYRARRTFEAVLPTSFPLHLQPVVAGSYRSDLIDVYFEASKSLFYSIWAY